MDLHTLETFFADPDRCAVVERFGGRRDINAVAKWARQVAPRDHKGQAWNEALMQAGFNLSGAQIALRRLKALHDGPQPDEPHEHEHEAAYSIVAGCKTVLDLVASSMSFRDGGSTRASLEVQKTWPSTRELRDACASATAVKKFEDRFKEKFENKPEQIFKAGTLAHDWIARLNIQALAYKDLKGLRDRMIHRHPNASRIHTALKPEPPWKPVMYIDLSSGKRVEYAATGLQPFFALTLDLYIAGAYLLVYGQDEPPT